MPRLVRSRLSIAARASVCLVVLVLGFGSIALAAPSGSHERPASATMNPVDDQYVVGPFPGLFVAAPGILSNDPDPGIPRVDRGPEEASVFELFPDGSFTYTPRPGFIGTDAFTYVLISGEGASAPARVTLDVSVGDDPRLASSVTFSVVGDFGDGEAPALRVADMVASWAPAPSRSSERPGPPADLRVSCPSRM